ncbi:hypothetical protein THAOC_05247 [Thalassiosira oceanica]|uniref:Uncharacterized protein n=1 Tax=Thalassiosira oceanica TaxID=159749 RepID=K0THL5_THAOC|nr:hypothetical protein THAOC_05247 [Thalassiosira oceanica]|eukprot:EJK73146.1 hypothetical protein THAOC_05247 [Thalassiosira oceanica]
MPVDATCRSSDAEWTEKTSLEVNPNSTRSCMLLHGGHWSKTIILVTKNSPNSAQLGINGNTVAVRRTREPERHRIENQSSASGPSVEQPGAASERRPVAPPSARWPSPRISG